MDPIRGGLLQFSARSEPQSTYPLTRIPGEWGRGRGRIIVGYGINLLVCYTSLTLCLVVVHQNAKIIGRRLCMLLRLIVVQVLPLVIPGRGGGDSPKRHDNSLLTSSNEIERQRKGYEECQYESYKKETKGI